jgi:cytochrome c oxidase assembly protein subunit 15
MRDELAAVQRGQAFDNRIDETRIVFEIPSESLSREVIGAAALARSKFNELGFLFRGQGDFHETQASRPASDVNRTDMKSSASAVSSGIEGTSVKTGSYDGNLRPIALWLLLCCAMIFAMVVIGGITRLTVSGLSITEWQPVVGILPPLSPAAWAAEFEKYQHIPQYRLVTYGMSLDQFKTIYLWEYFHRLGGRLIGFAYALPLLYFVLRRRLPRPLMVPLAGILLFGFLQGALGWYMVTSGLADRVEVSQYRLVAHLALALLIYAATLWIALGVLAGWTRRLSDGRVGAGWRRAAEAIIALVVLTITAGGFVAGLHAGLTYNTFPLMDGSVVPAGYAQLQPFMRNWFENIAAVQFDHRLLAMMTSAAVLLVWLAGCRATLPRPVRHALHGLLAATALQFCLGVATLLLVVPIPLAAAHQAGAVLLLTAAIVLRHRLRPPELDLVGAAAI